VEPAAAAPLADFVAVETDVTTRIDLSNDSSGFVVDCRQNSRHPPLAWLVVAHRRIHAQRLMRSFEIVSITPTIELLRYLLEIVKNRPARSSSSSVRWNQLIFALSLWVIRP